jgi:5-methylcytosine-specific restriction protein A
MAFQTGMLFGLAKIQGDMVEPPDANFREDPMPRANRHCSFPGCLKPVKQNGRCSKHPFDRLTQAWSRQTDYGDRVPDAIKRFVLRRDNYTCRNCSRPGNEVDHIKPKFLGGGDNLDNFQVLCSACHSKKSSEEGHLALRMKRESALES